MIVDGEVPSNTGSGENMGGGASTAVDGPSGSSGTWGILTASLDALNCELIVPKDYLSEYWRDKEFKKKETPRKILIE